eukprot:2745934-Rhodomonas_salina.1
MAAWTLSEASEMLTQLLHTARLANAQALLSRSHFCPSLPFWKGYFNDGLPKGEERKEGGRRAERGRGREDGGKVIFKMMP